MNTPVNKAGPETKSRFNYLVFLDMVVVACILVVAARPDGLAITLSAIIVAACAVIYRCSLGIKTTLASKPRAPAPPRQAVDRKIPPATNHGPEQPAATGGPRSKSWLRDSD